MISFIFKGRIPSVNFTYRTAKAKGLEKISPCKTFTKSIKEETERQLQANYPDFKIKEKPLRVLINVFYKNKKFADLDNCLKSLLDAFNKVLYTDDKQIDDIHIKRFINQQEDKFEIIIEEY